MAVRASSAAGADPLSVRVEVAVLEDTQLPCVAMEKQVSVAARAAEESGGARMVVGVVPVVRYGGVGHGPWSVVTVHHAALVARVGQHAQAAPAVLRASRVVRVPRVSRLVRNKIVLLVLMRCALVAAGIPDSSGWLLVAVVTHASMTRRSTQLPFRSLATESRQCPSTR